MQAYEHLQRTAEILALENIRDRMAPCRILKPQILMTVFYGNDRLVLRMLRIASIWKILEEVLACFLLLSDLDRERHGREGLRKSMNICNLQQRFGL